MSPFLVHIFSVIHGHVKGRWHTLPLERAWLTPWTRLHKVTTSCPGTETGFFPQILKTSEDSEDQIMPRRLVYFIIPLSLMPVDADFSREKRLSDTSGTFWSQNTSCSLERDLAEPGAGARSGVFQGRATQASVGERPSPLDELPNDPLWGVPNRSVISGKAFCISYLLCKKIIPKLKCLDNNTSYFNLPESRISV